MFEEYTITITMWKIILLGFTCGVAGAISYSVSTKILGRRR
jgi:hypothetical protein